ncbi:hypothetical protein B0H19DRAFT_1365268 [Mycena capillaripes]|nr:hypothetical protein B0H19DRAFT_1365268 [Mycena capillaripes]
MHLSALNNSFCSAPGRRWHRYSILKFCYLCCVLVNTLVGDKKWHILVLPPPTIVLASNLVFTAPPLRYVSLSSPCASFSHFALVCLTPITACTSLAAGPVAAVQPPNYASAAGNPQPINSVGHTLSLGIPRHPLCTQTRNGRPSTTTYTASAARYVYVLPPALYAGCGTPYPVCRAAPSLFTLPQYILMRTRLHGANPPLVLHLPPAIVRTCPAPNFAPTAGFAHVSAACSVPAIDDVSSRIPNAPELLSRRSPRPDSHCSPARCEHASPTVDPSHAAARREWAIPHRRPPPLLSPPRPPPDSPLLDLIITSPPDRWRRRTGAQ